MPLPSCTSSPSFRANISCSPLTNPDFRDLLQRRIGDALPPRTTIEYFELPLEMQKQVDHVLSLASKEVSPQVLEAAVEAEADAEADPPL